MCLVNLTPLWLKSRHVSAYGSTESRRSKGPERKWAQ
jgi:hypothetical protein